MQLEFIAHATFKIVLSDGRVIVIDPYLPMSFQGRFNYPPFRTNCDFALITHEHLDHSYIGDLEGHPVIVRQAWKDAHLSVSSIFAFHDSVGGSRFGGYVLMKLFEADGVRILHMGDCGERLSDEVIRQIGHLDALIVPVGGFYTMDADLAFDTASRIDTRTIIPCHYKTPLCLLPIDNIDKFLSHYAVVPQIFAQVDIADLPGGIVHLHPRFE